MNYFKIGDIGYDRTNLEYAFCKIVKIVHEQEFDNQIWGYWASSLKDLLAGKYLNPNHLMYTTSKHLIKVDNVNNYSRYRFLFEPA